MAGAKLTPSPSEIDPDVKTEVQKTPTPEPTWVNPSMAARTMGSFGSDTGQRYGSPQILQRGDASCFSVQSGCKPAARLHREACISQSSRAAKLQQQQQQRRPRNVSGAAWRMHVALKSPQQLG